MATKLFVRIMMFKDILKKVHTDLITATKTTITAKTFEKIYTDFTTTTTTKTTPATTTTHKEGKS